jgi:hypothetical protein
MIAGAGRRRREDTAGQKNEAAVNRLRPKSKEENPLNQERVRTI